MKLQLAAAGCAALGVLSLTVSAASAAPAHRTGEQKFCLEWRKFEVRPTNEGLADVHAAARHAADETGDAYVRFEQALLALRPVRLYAMQVSLACAGVV
jgi:hypothetical protein